MPPSIPPVSPAAHLFILVVEKGAKYVAEGLNHVTLVSTLEGELLELPWLALFNKTHAPAHTQTGSAGENTTGTYMHVSNVLAKLTLTEVCIRRLTHQAPPSP